MFRKYGIHRSLEPKNALPRLAWKLDADMDIDDDEARIDLEVVSMNEVGFNQIYEEYSGDREKMCRRILEIITQRGKLHNPVTGTGGTFYGRVAALGHSYPAHCGIRVGDAVTSYSSITLIPMHIERIHDLDMHTGQIAVSGQAIVYSHYPIIRRDPDIPLKIQLAVIDHASAAAETYRLACDGDRVMIMGATGRIGLISAFAAREKIGPHGRLCGIVKSAHEKKSLARWKLFDNILVTDATDAAHIRSVDLHWHEAFDRVINCINYPNTELLSLALCREGGTIYFSTMGADVPMATLTAEGMGRELEIEPYKNIVTRQALFLLDLLKRRPELVSMLEDKFSRVTRIRKESAVETPPQAEPHAAQEQSLVVDGEEFVFKSASMRKVLDAAMKVAAYDATVMLNGDSGVGKEIMARLIHDAGRRRIFPYIKINCAAIPETLLESELFGYERGAFTGADPRGKIGYWEKAQNGTLFLDEVSEISLATQSKLLRAIQENEIHKIGSANVVKTNVRIIAASNRDLRQMVRSGQFREDLYYRLNVYPLRIPRLSERKEDIVPLAVFFTKKYSASFAVNKRFSQDALARIGSHHWEGNIRELQNFVQRIMIEVDGPIIHLADVRSLLLDEGDSRRRELQPSLPEQYITPESHEGLSLDEALDKVECRILQAGKKKWRTSRNIAAGLGISQNKVIRLLKKHCIIDG